MKTIDAAFSKLEKLISELQNLENNNNDSKLADLALQLDKELNIVKTAASEIMRENESQKGEIRWLRSKIAGAGDFKMRDTVYYTNSGDGPYCPFCYEKRGRGIRLMELPPDSNGASLYKCRVCESTFNKK